MNMAQNAGGMNAGNLFAMGQQQQPQQQNTAPQNPVNAWKCECGQTGNVGKFCMNCGKPKPAESGWTCSCGTVNKGKFCQECGSPNLREHHCINAINVDGSRKILIILQNSVRSVAIYLMITINNRNSEDGMQNTRIK